MTTPLQRASGARALHLPLLVPMLATVAAQTTGCSTVGADLPRATVTRLEVWNRTLQPIWLTDAERLVLRVPACGRAAAPSYAVDRVEIRTEDGYVATFGAAEPDPRPPRPQYLVVTASPGPFEPLADLPEVPLPECARQLPTAE